MGHTYTKKKKKRKVVYPKVRFNRASCALVGYPTTLFYPYSQKPPLLFEMIYNCFRLITKGFQVESH